jgi:aromatic ring-opening dioxygenase catalytic subunit (LigB family)
MHSHYGNGFFRNIHGFTGIREASFDVQYPAPGQPVIVL